MRPPVCQNWRSRTSHDDSHFAFPHRHTQALAAFTPDSAGDIAWKSDAGAPDQFAPHNAPR